MRAQNPVKANNEPTLGAGQADIDAASASATEFLLGVDATRVRITTTTTAQLGRLAAGQRPTTHD